jgi:HlyD family secretion protein
MASEVRLTGIGGRMALSHAGQIIQISPDRVLDEHTREAWFVVQVDVSDFAAGEDKTLNTVRPGLPADVLIPLRKRTALGYLLEPLNQSLWRSMREE